MGVGAEAAGGRATAQASRDHGSRTQPGLQ